MNIFNQIGGAVRKFVSENHGRRPDRLIINYDKFNELRLQKDAWYFAGPLFDVCMGMKVITTQVDIDGGFEVR